MITYANVRLSLGLNHDLSLGLSLGLNLGAGPESGAKPQVESWAPKT